MDFDLKKKVCNESFSSNTLLEKYLLHGINKNGKVINNELAVYLLESKLQFKHRLGGLHRIFLVIINDLTDLLESPSLNEKLIGRISNSATGYRSSIKNVKKLIEDIITTLKILTSPKHVPIDLVKELEEPIIQAIFVHLMGGNKNQKQGGVFGFSKKNPQILNARHLFKQILIYVFYNYASPWGLQIHYQIEITNETKEALKDIVRFYLHNSIFGFTSNFFAKRIFKITNLGLQYIAPKYLSGKENLDELINNYISNINNEIKERYVCNQKKNNKSCSNRNIIKEVEIKEEEII